MKVRPLGKQSDTGLGLVRPGLRGHRPDSLGLSLVVSTDTK